MWKLLIVASTLAISVSHSVEAQTQKQFEGRYSSSYKTCLSGGEAAQGITSAMINCNSDEIDRQDARLNQVYKMVMMRLSTSKKATLRASERAWIAQRDAGCRREAESVGGGSLSGILYGSCILNETIKRTIWLENYD